jgi:archaellum component FlaC
LSLPKANQQTVGRSFIIGKSVAAIRHALFAGMAAILMLPTALPAVSQIQSKNSANNACGPDCRQARAKWQRAAKKTKQSRNEIERLRLELKDLDQQFSRKALQSNRLSDALSKLKRKRRQSIEALRQETNGNERKRLQRSQESARRLIKQLTGQFDDTRTQLAKIEKSRTAKIQDRKIRLASYKKLSAAEAAARNELNKYLKNEDARPDVYARFDGSFDQCLTRDATITASSLNLPLKDWHRFLNRKDKSYPPKNKSFARIARRLAKNNSTRLRPPYRKNFPCPGLSKGHALSGREVCRIMTKSPTARPRVWDDGTTYCEIKPPSGGMLALPTWVCRLYGQKKLGLAPKVTSNFVRWTADNHAAVCFFFKKTKVAGIVRGFNVSGEEKQLGELRKKIKNLEEYIAKENAFADAIETDFKANVDPAGIDAAIQKQSVLKSEASTDKQKEEETLAAAEHAIAVHKKLLHFMKTSPDDPDKLKWVVKKAEKVAAVAELRSLRGAKYITGVGALAEIIAIPVEKFLKDRVRKHYVDETKRMLNNLARAKIKIQSAINAADGRWWSAHTRWNKYKAASAGKDRHEIDASNASVQIRSLKAKAADLEKRIAAQ